MNNEHIPEELRDRPQWVVWKTVRRGDKEAKVPFQPSGEEAKSNDPETWATFDQAVAVMDDYDGVGFVFSHYDGYVGIDFDGCRDPITGRVAQWAKDAILKLDSYSEVSPSKTGVKVWVRGTSPFESGKKKELDEELITEKKKPGIEIYSFGRYFAVTGLRLSGIPEGIEERELHWIRSQFWPPPKAAKSLPSLSDDGGVAERARKYVDKIPEAVSGSGGHNQTFHVACVLCMGFGLRSEEAIGIMQEYNQRCQPLWTEKDLLHKLNDAAKQPGERNYLRDATPAQLQTIQVPTYRTTLAPPEERKRVKATLEEAAKLHMEHLGKGDSGLLSLGLPGIDEALGGGVDRGEVVIIAARPSHGKSAVALQCVHTLTAESVPCLFISEEMSVRSIGKRAVHYASEFPSEDWLAETAHVQSELESHFEKRSHCHIVEACGTVDAVVEEIHHAVDHLSVEVVVVDYAQLLKSKGHNSYEEVSNVSKALRRVTSECGITMLMLCQMNREIESRNTFMPKMRDLRDAGQLEQDADVILFLCWPHCLDTKKDPYEYLIFVSKNRNRPIVERTVKCHFNPSRQMVVHDRPVSFGNYDVNCQGGQPDGNYNEFNDFT